MRGPLGVEAAWAALLGRHAGEGSHRQACMHCQVGSLDVKIVPPKYAAGVTAAFGKMPWHVGRWGERVGG